MRSIIYSYQYYQSASIQSSLKSILKIEQMMATFLWKGDLHAIRLKGICRPTKKGGYLKKNPGIAQGPVLKTNIAPTI